MNRGRVRGGPPRTDIVRRPKNGSEFCVQLMLRLHPTRTFAKLVIICMQRCT